MVQPCFLWRAIVKAISIDLDEVAKTARENKPKLIIAGGTAYSRTLGLGRIPRRSRTKSARYLLVDMSHISGLVAGGAHPSPIPHAHIVTIDHAQIFARSAFGRHPVER